MTEPSEISRMAQVRLDSRMGELTRSLRAAGRADRAAMGTPDPTFAQAIKSATEALRSFTAAFRVFR